MIDASEFSNVRREVEVFLETIKKDEKCEDSDYESDEKTIILKEQIFIYNIGWNHQVKTIFSVLTNDVMPIFATKIKAL